MPDHLSKPTEAEKVAAYLLKLPFAQREAVECLKDILLAANPEVGVCIKWNSPCFVYTGPMAPFQPKEYKRDIVVANLHKGDILLVFPTGARIADSTGLLEGTYTDGRRLLWLADQSDVERKKEALETLIALWIEGVERP